MPFGKTYIRCEKSEIGLCDLLGNKKRKNRNELSGVGIFTSVYGYFDTMRIYNSSTDTASIN